MKKMMLSLFFVLMSTVSFGQKMMTSEIQTNAIQTSSSLWRVQFGISYKF